MVAHHCNEQITEESRVAFSFEVSNRLFDFGSVEAHPSKEVELLREGQGHDCENYDSSREGLRYIWIYLGLAVERGINYDAAMRISKNLKLLRGYIYYRVT